MDKISSALGQDREWTRHLENIPERYAFSSALALSFSQRHVQGHQMLDFRIHGMNNASQYLMSS
jgi:hypothetical protein